MNSVSQKPWLLLISLLVCQSSLSGQTTTGNPWHDYQPPGTVQRVAPHSSFDAMSTIAPPRPTQANLASGIYQDSWLHPTSYAGQCNPDAFCLGTNCLQTNAPAFDDFISPITNPIYFEDPRNLTEIRTLFIQQKIPLPAGCGDFQVYAGQFRASISENLSFVMFVADQKLSREFYCKVFDADPVLDVVGMTEFQITRDVTLGIMPQTGIAKIIGANATLTESAQGVSRCEAYLRLGSATELMERAIAAGGELVSPLSERDWGETVGYVADLDGHILAFAAFVE